MGVPGWFFSVTLKSERTRFSCKQDAVVGGPVLVMLKVMKSLSRAWREHAVFSPL